MSKKLTSVLTFSIQIGRGGQTNTAVTFERKKKRVLGLTNKTTILHLHALSAQFLVHFFAVTPHPRRKTAYCFRVLARPKIDDRLFSISLL